MRPVSSHFSRILESANRHPERGKIIVAALLGVVAIAIVSPFVIGVISALVPELAGYEVFGNQTLIGANPGGAFLVLGGYVTMGLVTIFCARRLHARKISDLTGPSVLMRRQFMATLKSLAILIVVTSLLPWDGDNGAVSSGLPFGQWLFWLPFALLAIVIQTGAEELFFRGYLMPQITAASGSLARGVIISSLFFGALHLVSGGDLTALAFYMFWAFCFGVVCCDLTIRSGTIGPAVALHLMNNAAIILIAPPKGDLSGFGLWIRSDDMADLLADPLLMAFQMLLLVTMWLASRLAIKR